MSLDEEQTTWRTRFRDHYFVKTSLLGTHTCVLNQLFKPKNLNLTPFLSIRIVLVQLLHGIHSNLGLVWIPRSS